MKNSSTAPVDDVLNLLDIPARLRYAFLLPSLQEWELIWQAHFSALENLALSSRNWISLPEEERISQAEAHHVHILAYLDASPSLPNQSVGGWLHTSVEGWENALSKVPKVIHDLQSPDRFRWCPTDSGVLRLKKLPKMTGEYFLRSGWAIRNIGLSLLGKKLEPRKRRSYSVPAADLLGWCWSQTCYPVLNDSLLSFLQAWNEDFASEKQFSAHCHQQFLIDQKPSLDGEPVAYGQALLRWKDALEPLLEKAIADCQALFCSLWPIAGTVELPHRKFKPKKHRAFIQRIHRQSAEKVGQWVAASALLKDRWATQTEFQGFAWGIRERSISLVRRWRQRLDQRVSPSIAKADKALLDIATQAKSAVSTTVLEAAFSATHPLNQVRMPQCVDALVEADLPLLFGDLEQYISKQPDLWKPERKGKAGFELGKPLKGIPESFSPQQLVRFEALPQYEGQLTQLKKDLVALLQSVQGHLFESGQIAAFNLETALNLLAQQKADLPACHAVALEGLDRAQFLFKGQQTALEAAATRMDQALAESFGPLAKEMEKLSALDYLFNLRVRMVKAKTLERTRQWQYKVWAGIRFAVPNAAKWIKEQYLSGRVEFDQLRQRLGLLQKQSKITSGLSDFLSETEITIHRLPLVYQRLFRPEPLTDNRLFVGREAELAALDQAFTNWKLGRYAPVAIIGEPGAGATTLLHQFLAQISAEYSPVLCQPPVRICDAHGLVLFLAQTLGYEGITEEKELVDRINASTNPRVLVLEHAEMCFLKKIDGFTAMRLLIRLMSATNGKLFWICTFDQFAWEYLAHTLQIPDYLGYVIPLEAMRDETIRELILKRNSLSGFRLVFEGSELDQKAQAYQKLSPEGRKSYLKDIFFQDLNRLAQSNLTVSFLFWLRSTQPSGDGELIMQSLKGLDFGFMQHLSTPKWVALHTLVLHGQMQPIYHAQACGWPLAQSQNTLLLMADDGILLRQPGDFFAINPLLYRQTVKILKDKNFIH